VPEVLGEIPDISFVTFDQRDVVRHKLVQRIVAAYKEYGERSAGRRDPGGRR
jgi:phosphate starvation-inducible PhoH-like protein